MPGSPLRSLLLLIFLAFSLRVKRIKTNPLSLEIFNHVSRTNYLCARRTRYTCLCPSAQTNPRRAKPTARNSFPCSIIFNIPTSCSILDFSVRLSGGRRSQPVGGYYDRWKGLSFGCFNPRRSNVSCLMEQAHPWSTMETLTGRIDRKTSA